MIVVVILGLLAAIAIPRYLRASKKSKISEAGTILKQIFVASMEYYEANGCYPPEVDDIFGEGEDDLPDCFI